MWATGSAPREEQILEVASRRGEQAREARLSALRTGVLGAYRLFSTPYGDKPIVYADWTASGRSLRSVEEYLLRDVMPFYGNTHTDISITGHQSTCFRHEARQIIAQAVNAKVTGKAAEDLVVFVGNGTTAAVHKLVHSLGLHVPLASAAGGNGGSSSSSRPLVFTSSYEHHSNLLPWRESVAEVVTIKYSATTGVCLDDLAEKLCKYADRRVLKIGAFSAASNVTGIITAVDQVCTLMHTHGGLAFFDYATAAPYVHIDMNPATPGESLAYKDAIYFSGHKFIGGPGTPGVLIVKRKVLSGISDTPAIPGGGTVFYVTEHHHRYSKNREDREEGGTPQVLGDVKLGLVLNIKQSIGSQWIQQEELRISALGAAKLRAGSDRIVLLGRPDAEEAGGGGQHLPIFSFLIRSGARFLHHNFVCALLNDLFGIQSRSGCQCAGPFSQQLLGLTLQANANIEATLLEKHEVLRPGYSRLSLPYWTSPVEMDYILDAVVFVARHGASFLPDYRYNHRTGEWAHATRLTRFPERKWISHFDIVGGGEGGGKEGPEGGGGGATSSTDATAVTSDDNLPALFHKIVASVDLELHAVQASRRSGGISFGASHADSGIPASLRWFVLPGEAEDGAAELQPLVGPIQPPPSSQSFGQDGPLAADMDVVVAVPEFSAFGQHRSEQLKAHIGGAPLPRYMELAGERAGEGALERPKGGNQSHNAGKKEKKKAKQEERKEEKEPEEKKCLMGSCSTAPLPSGNSSSSSVCKDVAPLPKVTVPKKLMKLVGQCVREWDMIKEGDKLLLGLSGGKDSLSMLHVLIALQKRAPIRFTIACATVDPQTPSFDPSPLIPYMQSLGITYHFLSQPIVDMAASRLQGDSLCAFCARFKRGLLYSCCRDNGYTKLVLAQHLDDFAESFLMSALHNGQMRTMKANYSIDAGDLVVIRPFAYVREKDTRAFAQEARLPIINENCPACFEQPKERARVKQLLAQEESMVPALFFNLRRALLPLMDDSSYDAMAKVAEKIANAGNERNDGRSRKREAQEVLNTEGDADARGGLTKKPTFELEVDCEGGSCKDLFP